NDRGGGSSSGEPGGTVTRLDAAKRLLGSGDDPLRDYLNARYQVDVVACDTTAQPLTPSKAPEARPAKSISQQIAELTAAAGAAGGTRLGDAIDFALRQLPGPRPVAAIVLSDGVVTQGTALSDAATHARTAGTPI